MRDGEIVGKEPETVAELGDGLIKVVTERETIYAHSKFQSVVQGMNRERVGGFDTREEATQAGKKLAVKVSRELLAEAEALQKK